MTASGGPPGSGAGADPGLARKQRVVEMNALALQAGAGEYPDGRQTRGQRGVCTVRCWPAVNGSG
jgi:hypothetical protein